MNFHVLEFTLILNKPFKTKIWISLYILWRETQQGPAKCNYQFTWCYVPQVPLRSHEQNFIFMPSVLCSSIRTFVSFWHYKGIFHVPEWLTVSIWRNWDLKRKMAIHCATLKVSVCVCIWLLKACFLISAHSCQFTCYCRLVIFQ
jgi:hypothetical protein